MEETKPEAKESSYLVPAAIVVAGLLIASAVLYSNKTPQPGSLTGEAKQPARATVDLSDNDPTLGDPSASVTLVEFADFQCPFCEKFFQTAEKEIIEKYVKTGKAKLVYRDFPLSSIHPFAQKSAEAGECANEQGKFWQYHDFLYEHQNDLSLANLKIWAKDLGLNSGQFNVCLDTGKYEKEVEGDLNAGIAAGVEGTPATFVNGRLVSGAVPFAQFQAAIEVELKKGK